MSVGGWRVGGAAGGGGRGTGEGGGKFGDGFWGPWRSSARFLEEFAGAAWIDLRNCREIVPMILNRQGLCCKFAVEIYHTLSENFAVSDETLSRSEESHFVEMCLEQPVRCAAEFDRRYRKKTEAFLVAKGAHEEEAKDAFAVVVSQCFSPAPDKVSKFMHFDGSCALQTWLNKLTLNQFFTYKRRERLMESLDALPGGREKWAGSVDAAESERMPLLELLRSAILAAFQACTAEDFVMLQLAHGDGIMHKELATIFRCDEPAMSRRLKSAREGIRDATLGYIKHSDPYLKLKWQDFMDLVRSKSLGELGYS